MTIQLIDPERAQQLLQQNTSNRALNKNAVARYAEIMLRKEWRVGNDAICIGEDGTLLNGQHRLNAVVRAGIAVEFLIREDVKKDDLMAMDQGTKRNGADIVTLMGHKMSKPHSKVLRVLATPWDFRTTIATPTPDELIRLDQEWGAYVHQAIKLVPTDRKNLAIPVAVATSAIRWQSENGEIDNVYNQIADFFSIMFTNMPETGRTVDPKGEDYYAFLFNGFYCDLMRDGKRLSAFAHYKRVAYGLSLQLNNAEPKKRRNFQASMLTIPDTNPFA